MDTNSIMQEMSAAIDARIDRLKKIDNISQARKWERERAFLVTPSMAEFLSENTTVPLNRIGDLAIYTVEKVRKIARKMTAGKGNLDNYTTFLLRKAEVLARKNVHFTYGLQRAALSKGIEMENAHKMGTRLACSPATANSQSCTSRAAMLFLGMASDVRRADDATNDANYVAVDFNHPVVKAALAPAKEAKAAA